ncbi:MAG: glycosyltransferase family 39 protein, partial [Bauldia sp.]|nr:glycosyltransferase family 39 protein [Bauldia sp.]
VFAYLLTVVDARRWLKTPGPWLGGLVGLLVFSPVLIWNAEHGWESFLFQGGRAVPEGGLSLRLLGENVLLQIALLLPWIFVPLALALGAAMIAGPREPRRWFFVCLAAGPILVFTLVNLWRPGFPHWPMPGWLFVFPLAGATLAALSGPGLAWARRSAVASAVAFVAILAVFLVQAETGLVGRAFPAIIAAGDPAFIVHDWDELPPALGERALLGDGRFVAALDWETVAAAAYALGPGVAVLCLCEAEHQFKYLHDRFAFAGQEAAIVGWPQTIRERMTYLSRTFERTEPDAPVTLTMAGRPVAELAVLKGYGFRPAGDR